MCVRERVGGGREREREREEGEIKKLLMLTFSTQLAHGLYMYNRTCVRVCPTDTTRVHVTITLFLSKLYKRMQSLV